MLNSQGSVCPAHPAVTMLSYGGQQWCRFCAINKQRVVDDYRRFLMIAHWGLVASVPLFFFGLAAFAPISPFIPIGEQPRSFWLWLLLPTTFLTACLALMIGHTTIRWWQRLSSDSFLLLPWFHPTHALRDFTAVALLSSPIYAALIYFGRELPLIGAAQETTRGWLLWRAPIVFLTTFVALKILTHFKLSTPDTLVPPVAVERQNRFIAWYGIVLALCYLSVNKYLSQWAMSRPGSGVLMVAVAIGSVALVCYLGLRILIRLQATKLGAVRSGPIPATIAIVGPSNTGKTVFFCRAYSLLQTVRRGMVNLSPTPQSLSAMSSHIDDLENRRKWPPPTVQPSEVPFSLYHGLDEMIQFKWLDLPGEVFNNPNAPQHQVNAQHFDQHLINSDGVAMLIDANDLVAAMNGPIKHEQIYLEIARRLHTRLQQIGPGARPVPLALIVTQCCRVGPEDLLKLPRRLANLENLWQNLAMQCGLPRPPVKIFLSSAVVNDRSDPTNSVPSVYKERALRSRNCMEPVIWLAAQTARMNIGLMDDIMGLNGHSELQLAILRLEALCQDSLRG